MSALTLSGIRVGDRLVVDDLRLEPGLCTLVGENGAGKSTLLDVAAGVLGVDAGTAALDGRPLSSLSPIERARSIASLGQAPRSAPWLLASERIAQGLAPRGVSSSSPVAMAAVAAVAAELGLGPLLDRPLLRLSGGEQQRVHVARALVDDRAVAVLLDEPFAGLDEGAAALLVAALQRRARSGVVVVVSVHDLGLAALLGGRVLGLSVGRVVVDGSDRAALVAAAGLLGGDLRIVDDGEAVGVLRLRRVADP